MSKLVGKTNDEEATATKVVGTFGYLAPEYVRISLVGYSLSLRVLQNSLTVPLLFSYRYLSDGLASSKSDVYAFGVVLFEIVSGKEATIRTEGTTMKNSERRSLASFVSSTF